ncbi:MFS transporter [Limosilactobacillus sp. RRLNB_1_1]|uniref:MFS transporter n=1 Tax=Limosilactobacillus albertensis TaxID=2759752 RepID=A0A7W3TT27_9LACO|nr:MFS transporter [Limosilactobacillus albertensis]MBB1070400.1 MFS transporter [Limosilactobacillus albertensis]MCD7117546.1 MFS transporter [Limosilactobacillus albertensis]MCD7127894.1 MFS transporter [Limosilactobacillus albertensis]
MTKEVKRIIIVILFCEFLICLGMSLIFPVEPFIKNEYHFTAFDMGVMSSLFAFVQFIASPIVGRISDKLGRKPMLVWGLLIFAIAEFVFALAQHLWVFDLSRAVDGLSAAMFVPTSMALAADITSEKDRAKVIGWLSAAFSGGLILGPGLGGMLAHVNYKFPFWIAGILGLISTAIAWRFLPHDEDILIKSETKNPENELLSSGWSQIKQIMTPMLITLFGMIFVAAFGLAGFESIYSLYVNEVHNFDLSAIALVLTLNGIISLILQVFFFDRLVRWLGEVRLMRYSFFLSVIGTILVIYDHSHWHIIVATLFVFEAFDLLRPTITTLLTKMSTANQGLLNGINMSLTSVGNIIGPLISGYLLDVNYQYPYWFVTAFLIISWVITFVLGRERKSMVNN